MLKADALRAAHDAEPLFDDVSFVLADGDRVGLVGPNGVGKSTLLRLLAGRARPDAGSVSVGDCDRVSYLEQQPPDPDLTLGEHLRRSAGEVYAVDREMRALETAMATGDDAAVAAYGALQHRYEALDGWRFRDTIDQVRRHIGITGLSDGARFRELSGGQAARVMLAGVLLSRPTVLLLDEPTNHLDLDGIRWLERYLSSFPGAVLVVTHDRRFLDETVSRILELDPVTRGLAVYEGGYTAFRVEKQRLFERRQEEHRAQERYRKRLEADIARTRGQAAATESTASGDGQRPAQALRQEGGEEGQGPRGQAGASDGRHGTGSSGPSRRPRSRSPWPVRPSPAAVSRRWRTSPRDTTGWRCSQGSTWSSRAATGSR